jgi:hypothetical protein
MPVVNNILGKMSFRDSLEDTASALSQSKNGRLSRGTFITGGKLLPTIHSYKGGP